MKLVFEDIVAELNSLVGDEDPTDPKTRTRARILRSAQELFEERGYRRTSIDEVARQSGIAKGTVYVHFASKAELLLHVLVGEKKRLIGRFKAVFTDPLEPEERLLRHLELLLRSFEDAPMSMRLLTGDRELELFLEELPPEIRALFEARQAAGVAALLEGLDIPEAERADRALAFQGILYAIGHLAQAGERVGLAPERYARQLAKILVGGVSAR